MTIPTALAVKLRQHYEYYGLEKSKIPDDQKFKHLRDVLEFFNVGESAQETAAVIKTESLKVTDNEGLSNSQRVEKNISLKDETSIYPDLHPMSDPFSSEISSLLDAEFSDTKSENELLPVKVEIDWFYNFNPFAAS